MKKMTYFVMALALVLGFTQCKKEQTPTNNQTEGVFITLNVNGGNNGSRVIVDPTGHSNPDYATVTFEDDDIIYVGYKGSYVGSLTYSGGTFSGSVSISEGDYGEKLHFYFLGGKGFTPTFVGNTATVNISNQTERYPVISYNTSNESFTGAGSYSAKLLNKVSIMKFNVTTPSSAAICITGMNNKVTLNFNPNTENTDQGFSYSVDTEDGGLIKMPAKDAEGTTWAIVLPQEEVLVGTAGTAYTDDGMCTGTRPAIDEIGSNQYLSGGVNMSVNEFTPLGTPLTLEALTDGNIVVNIIDIGGKGGGVYPGSSKGGPGGGRSGNFSKKYSLNGGVKTTIYETITIDVNAGDSVQLYGNGTCAQVYGGDHVMVLQGTAQTKVYGNIMSLIDETGYATLTTLPKGSFFLLFYGNENLTDASGLLLPATTLAEDCYLQMFAGCTSLTTAPALPATSLAEGCYSGMFYGCTSLTTAPTLPATTLASGCYSSMFSGCTSLTTAPALPVETLASDCYSYMFSDCTSLTTAPTLPAETLAEECYYGMFSGCTSLTTAPELPAPALAEWCYANMFNGCTSLTTAPELPATTLANSCYRNMFQGCTSLSSITCLATEGINENYSTNYWVDGVASTGTFNRASGATWPEGANGIPSGWTLVPPADLPAATVTTAPTAKTGVTAGQNEAIVNAGTAEGGTMMYMVTTENTKPTSTTGFSATVPTAEGLTAGTYYVWYYVQGDASHSDSEISATGIEVTIAAPTLADAFTDDAVVTVKVNTANSQWFGVTGTYTSGTYATTGIGSVLSPSSVSMTKDGSNLVATVTNSFNTYTVRFNSTDNTYMENATSSTLPWRMTELQSITINGVDITSQLTASPSETISLVNMGNSIEGTNFDVAGQGDSNDNGKQVNQWCNLTITAKNSKTIKEVALTYGSLSGNAGTLSASPGSYDGTNTITGINASSLTISSSSPAGVYISSVKIYY